MEMYLRCFCFENPKYWLKILPWAQYCYNTSFHHRIGMSPYKALYGREPLKLIRYELNDQDPVVVQDLLHQTDMTLDELKQNMARA